MKMMKRTLCLVLALVMLVGMFTIGASAQETEQTTEPSTVVLHFYVDGVKFAELPAEEIPAAYTNKLQSWLEEVRLNTLKAPRGYEFVDNTEWFWVSNDYPLADGHKTVNDDGSAKVCNIYTNIVEKVEEPVEPEDPVVPEVPSVPVTPAVPKNIFGTYKKAVEVSCGKDHHDDKAFDFTVKNANQVTMVTPTKAVVYLTDSDISTYVAKYNDAVGGKHTFTSKIAVAFTLELKCIIPFFPPVWVVSSEAELPVSCDCNFCGCPGWWHKHTVTYTDGVKNSVVFKDITYTVKHNGKTPVPATPTRAGYVFDGWTPKVAAKTTKCVTYTATWKKVDYKVPGLTTDHVAYLKGYGGGLVKPEGTITRAEAVTMLYRLMDASSAKEFYTPYNNFSDVAKDAWYNDAVSTLANAGVLRSISGKFNPNEEITRAEFFFMLTKFSKESYSGKCNFTDVPSNHWAYEELALAQYLGWVKGYGGGVVYPDDTISRAEVAAVLNRVLDRDDCKTVDAKNFIDNPTNAWYYQDIVEASNAH